MNYLTPLLNTAISGYAKTLFGKKKSKKGSTKPNSARATHQNPTTDYGFGQIGNTYKSVHVAPLVELDIDQLTPSTHVAVTITMDPTAEMAKIFDYFKILSLNIHIMGSGEITVLPLSLCWDPSGTANMGGFSDILSYRNSKTVQLSPTFPVAHFRVDKPTHPDDDNVTLTTMPMVTDGTWTAGVLYLGAAGGAPGNGTIKYFVEYVVEYSEPRRQ